MPVGGVVAGHDVGCGSEGDLVQVIWELHLIHLVNNLLAKMVESSVVGDLLSGKASLYREGIFMKLSLSDIALARLKTDPRNLRGGSVMLP